MKISSQLYDTFKWIAQLLLPGLGTLYFGVASIWHLPYATEVVGTIMALDAFLGFLLGISSNTYKADVNAKKIADLELQTKYAQMPMQDPQAIYTMPPDQGPPPIK